MNSNNPINRNMMKNTSNHTKSLNIILMKKLQNKSRIMNNKQNNTLNTNNVNMVMSKTINQKNSKNNNKNYNQN